MTDRALQLRSLLSADGRLTLSLMPVAMPAPAGDEVVVEVRATPVNPSDLGLLLAAADPASARAEIGPDGPVTVLRVPEASLPGLTARVGRAMPIGNEGAGLVIAAGPAPEARALLGRTVAALGGGMYATHRLVRAGDCLRLPEGATAEQGASCFVNPLTALGMVDTARSEGHAALVHTAAASNLGQMLVRICRADGVPLVNVVRSAAQADLLRSLGAAHVCDSSAEGFTQALDAAVAATEATLAFDAVGGGALAGQILRAMEAAAAARDRAPYTRYGSTVHKQVYLYGGLDTGPTLLGRDYGMAWGVGGWLLTAFLGKAGPDRVAALKARVAAELLTTFSSRYTRTVSLAQALHPETIVAYARRSTREKFLIDPSRAAGG